MSINILFEFAKKMFIKYIFSSINWFAGWHLTDYEDKTVIVDTLSILFECIKEISTQPWPIIVIYIMLRQRNKNLT